MCVLCELLGCFHFREQSTVKPQAIGCMYYHRKLLLRQILLRKVLEFLDGDNIYVLGTGCGGKCGAFEELSEGHKIGILISAWLGAGQ